MTTESQPILHQYQVSPFAAKVRRCLHFKGVAFRAINYGLTGVGKIRKLSPAGKAPVLEHNGRIIPDSTDIIEHLEACYPQRPVYPADPRERAMAHVLEDWADESLYFYDLTMRSWPGNATWLADDLVMEDSGVMKRVFHRLAPKLIAKQGRDQGTGRKPQEAVCADAARHFDAIETLVADREWLVGDTLSVADIAVVSMCTVLARAEEARALMASRTALLDWRNRVDSLTLPPGTPEVDKALV